MSSSEKDGIAVRIIVRSLEDWAEGILCRLLEHSPEFRPEWFGDDECPDKERITTFRFAEELERRLAAFDEDRADFPQAARERIADMMPEEGKHLFSASNEAWDLIFLAKAVFGTSAPPEVERIVSLMSLIDRAAEALGVTE